jgi:hypothetical protein
MNASSLSLATQPPKDPPTDSYVFPPLIVARTQHYLTIDLRRSIQVGDPITLVPEPANPTDPQSIRVHWQDQQIGYLCKDDNPLIFHLLRQGCPLTAVVAWFSPSTDPPITIYILLPKL